MTTLNNETLIQQANNYIISGQNQIKPKFFDNSMLSSFLQDPLAYQIKYLWGYEPKDENISAEFGKAIHSSLNNWWQFKDLELAKITFNENFHQNVMPEISIYNKITGEQVIERYHKQWSFDDRFELVDGSCEFNIIVPITGTEYFYVTKIDKLVMNKKDNSLIIVDHKTSSRNEFETYCYDRQFIGYLWALWKHDFNPKGVLIDGMTISTQDLSLRRVYETGYHIDIIKHFEKETKVVIENIYNCLNNDCFMPSRNRWLYKSPSLSWMPEFINNTSPKHIKDYISLNWQKRIWNPIS